MIGDFDDEDQYVAADFWSLVSDAQMNELREVDRARELERRTLDEFREKEKSMTLMQLAGLRSQKEVEEILHAKTTADDEQMILQDKQQKEQERERLQTPFPPPDL